MATIEKMSIRGIRSFSPDRDETIEFYSPLTMIVGANGCGKTTIIEALKFICTGTLPPNSNKGQSFVNDPAMTESTEVKANIKLRLNNKVGYPCVVTRSLQVLKKKTKLEFKALDGVIKTTNAQNEKVSLSHKCSDLDKLIPELMAVSAPILESVIFCHQEESNWPMQEGLVLKKKFDDIFESTRYTKALDAIAKTRKEFNDKAKDMKAELAEYSAHLQAANDTRGEVEVCEKNIETCNNELESNQEKLEHVMEKCERASKVIKESQEHEDALKALQIRLEESDRRLREKQASLEKVYSESSSELQDLLSNFDHSVMQRGDEIKVLQRQIDLINTEISRCRNRANELSTQKGHLDSLRQHLASERKRCLDDGIKLARLCDSAAPSQQTMGSMALLRQMVATFDEKSQQVEVDGRRALVETQSAVDRAESEVTDALEALHKKDVALSTKKYEREQIISEIARKKSEIVQLSNARAALQSNEAEFAEVRRNHDDFMESYNVKTAEFKKSTKEITDQIHALNELLSADAIVLQELNLNRKDISTLEAAERQTAQELVQLKSEISLIISNSSDLLQLLEPNVMTSSEPKNVEALATLVTSLSKLQLDKQYALHGARESLQNLRTRQAGLQALLRQERDRIFASKQRDEELNSEKETKMRAIVTKLNQLRRSEILEGEFADEAMFTPDASVETVIQHAEILTATVSEYKLSHRDAVVYQKKLEKLRVKNNGSCPCCNQKMDAAVTSSFQSNVEKIFRSGGANRTDADYDSLWTESAALVASLRALEKQLQATAPLKEEILKSQLDMSTMELQLREIGQAEVTSRDNVLALETLTGRLEKAHSSLSDSRVRWTSIVARTLEHQEKRRRYGQDGILSGARSIEDIETEQRQRMEQKDALQSRKEKIAGDEALLTKKFYSVKSSLAEAEKTQLEASTKKRQQGELEDANKTLQARSEEVDTWVQALTLDIAKSNQSLSDLQNRLKQVQSVHQDKDRAFSNKVNEISSEIVALRKMVTVIEDLDSKCNSSSVDEIDSQMQQNALAIHTKEEQIQSLLPRVTSLTSEMAMQERTKKQVRDNLDCRACLEEHEQLQRQWRIAEQRSGGGIEKLREAQRENQRAQQERQRYISEQDKLKGSLEVYSRQKKELQAKLNGPNYRGVEGRFQKKNIEYETTMLAVADLASYSEALDTALQNFHVIKIREINKIIRELWQLIYKGQDIDTIEIESGQDQDSAPSARKHSYNYRVVMRKGDAPLDMRGRCSAGQKVLAAIVIRLALAETFSLNCGILALDEPTTNLDEMNKSGLAHALARIIIERSSQHNFQLVCITHDEDFVRLMNNELSGTSAISLPEFYFRVSREEAGESGRFFSRIDRVRWEDMA